MTKEIYTDICERLKNDIIRLYKIKCWRCVRARIVRLARCTTEYNGSDYAQNLKYYKKIYSRFLHLYIEEISFTEFSYMFCSFITNPDKSHKDWLKLHISCSLGRIFSWCRAKNIDIAWHIEQKMKYNELRPFMHGGKAY